MRNLRWLLNRRLDWATRTRRWVPLWSVTRFVRALLSTDNTIDCAWHALQRRTVSALLTALCVTKQSKAQYRHVVLCSLHYVHAIADWIEGSHLVTGHSSAQKSILIIRTWYTRVVLWKLHAKTYDQDGAASICTRVGFCDFPKYSKTISLSLAMNFGLIPTS